MEFINNTKVNEQLLNSLQSNIENDYEEDLQLEQINKIREVFDKIITNNLNNQNDEYHKILYENQDLSGAINYGMSRIRKYGSGLEDANEEVVKKLKEYQEGVPPIYKWKNDTTRKNVSKLKPDNERLVNLNVPDKLESKRDYKIEGRKVWFDGEEMYLKDKKSNNPRVLQPLKDNERIQELTKTIWLAEKTDTNQYVWRAKVLADDQDVYKLLKFLTDNTDNPDHFQSIHINTGTHGYKGKGADDYKKAFLADPRILQEIKTDLTILENISKRQLQNISINTPNVLTESIYPENADHIIDTLCEGAMYKASGKGLRKPLNFLWNGLQEYGTSEDKIIKSDHKVSYFQSENKKSFFNSDKKTKFF